MSIFQERTRVPNASIRIESKFGKWLAHVLLFIKGERSRPGSDKSNKDYNGTNHSPITSSSAMASQTHCTIQEQGITTCHYLQRNWHLKNYDSSDLLL